LLSGLSNEVIGFGPWRLEPAERRLTCAGTFVDLNARYVDALLLLASHPGELITKERFMAEVWSGVPVTDEALTQCVRSLRRLLEDDAVRPRYIQTVPRHGYRFICEAETLPAPASPRSSSKSGIERRGGLIVMTTGLLGGAAAGLLGGLTYGLLAASNPPAGTGAISTVLVLTCLCVLIGLLGGAGIAAGVAITQKWNHDRLLPTMLGGALGGLIVGVLGRLLGMDTFVLLVGSRPVAITGGGEGMVIGAIAGAGAWLGLRTPATIKRIAAVGAALGALAGMVVTLCGGRLMGGSLAAVAAAYPNAPLGTLLKSSSLPSWAVLTCAMVEGATFVAAISLAFGILNAAQYRPAQRP
jgi:DNA-binding winged helix-turn-helix (wHTH) protein